MKRRRVIRIQLVLLVLLAVLVLVRMITGPPPPDGLVVMVDLEPFEVEHAAFEVMQPTRSAVEATGSFEEASDNALAAYGWIIRRGDRQVVWRQEAATSRAGRGHAAHQADTLILEPGTYDVYFASFGDRYASEHDRRRAGWRNDANQWKVVVNPLEEVASAQLTRDQRFTPVVQALPDLVWTTAPMRSDKERNYLFEVTQPATVQLYAVGEVGDDVADEAWIENVATRERVWSFGPDNTAPAGGIERNRRFDGAVDLTPGTYRAVVRTDRNHAFGDWWGNPPYDVASWGLSVQAEGGVMKDFDPWTSREPLISFMRVPDRTERSQRFEVTEPMEVVAYGVGEITSGGTYDYGELLKEEADRKHTVWKMSRSKSSHAGGGDKNRVEVAFLTLEPGTYTLRYVTDGSHAYDDWNTARPDYPERWGVSLFPMNPADVSAFRLLSGNQAGSWEAVEVPEAAPMPPGLSDGDVLVDWQGLRGDENLSYSFSLDEESRLHIVAVGEIAADDRYDYGWIERKNGDVVWSMTRENTRPAGGTDRNRSFDGVVTLPAGAYLARFRTDFSHHAGDFNGEAPEKPDAWGMKIYRVEGEIAEPAT